MINNDNVNESDICHSAYSVSHINKLDIQVSVYYSKITPNDYCAVFIILVKETELYIIQNILSQSTTKTGLRKVLRRSDIYATPWWIGTFRQIIDLNLQNSFTVIPAWKRAGDERPDSDGHYQWQIIDLNLQNSFTVTPGSREQAKNAQTATDITSGRFI